MKINHPISILSMFFLFTSALYSQSFILKKVDMNLNDSLFNKKLTDENIEVTRKNAMGQHYCLYL